MTTDNPHNFKWIDEEEGKLLKQKQRFETLKDEIESLRKDRMATPFWRPFKWTYLKLREYKLERDIFALPDLEKVLEKKQEEKMKEEAEGLKKLLENADEIRQIDIDGDDDLDDIL